MTYTHTQTRELSHIPTMTGIIIHIAEDQGLTFIMNFCGDIKKREKILNTNHFKNLKLSYLSRPHCSKWNYVNDKQKICIAVATELILNYMLGKCYSKQSLLKGIFTLVQLFSVNTCHTTWKMPGSISNIQALRRSNLPFILWKCLNQKLHSISFGVSAVTQGNLTKFSKAGGGSHRLGESEPWSPTSFMHEREAVPWMLPMVRGAFQREAGKLFLLFSKHSTTSLTQLLSLL